MIIEKTIQVSKEASELGDALVKVVASVRAALKDGFQPIPDTAAIGLAVYQDLIPGIQGAEKMGDESRESLTAFMNAWTQTGFDLAKELGLS